MKLFMCAVLLTMFLNTVFLTEVLMIKIALFYLFLIQYNCLFIKLNNIFQSAIVGLKAKLLPSHLLTIKTEI